MLAIWAISACFLRVKRARVSLIAECLRPDFLNLYVGCGVELDRIAVYSQF